MDVQPLYIHLRQGLKADVSLNLSGSSCCSETLPCSSNKHMTSIKNTRDEHLETRAPNPTNKGGFKPEKQAEAGELREQAAAGCVMTNDRLVSAAQQAQASGVDVGQHQSRAGPMSLTGPPRDNVSTEGRRVPSHGFRRFDGAKNTQVCPSSCHGYRERSEVFQTCKESHWPALMWTERGSTEL